MKAIAIASTLALIVAQPVRARAQSTTYDARYSTRVDTTVTLERGGTLSVSVYSGRVSVTGGSGNQVQIRGTTERGDLEIRARSTSVSISADEENSHRGRIDLDIVVPIGTRVVMDGFSSPFSVKGVKGEVDLETLSGNIIINDAVGNVKAEAVSGNVDIDGVAGDITAESVSGRITINNVKGDIDAETVSGRITMTGARSNTVRTESVSGSLSYDGTFTETGSYTFKTHSGRLSLGLPPSTGATVSLETYNGTVESDFPVTMVSKRDRGEGHESAYEFKLGDGKSRIVLETFSGNIRIMRGTTSQSRDQ